MIKISLDELKVTFRRLQGIIIDNDFSYIYLKTFENNKLAIMAYDHISWIYNYIRYEGKVDMDIKISANIISGILKELSFDFLTIGFSKENKMSLEIESYENKNFRLSIPIIGHKSWKSIPQFKYCFDINISCQSLLYMISQIEYSVSSSPIRDYNGVAYLHKSKKDEIRLVASDTFRLAYCGFKTDENIKNLEDGISISKKALTELKRLSKEGKENLNLRLSEDFKLISISVDRYNLFIRTSSVNFPDYSSVIPKKKKYQKLSVYTDDFKASIKRMLLASDESKTLNFNFKNNTLTMFCRTSNNLSLTEILEIKNFENDEINIELNAKFVLDIISYINSEYTDIYFYGLNENIILKPSQQPKNIDGSAILVPVAKEEYQV